VEAILPGYDVMYFPQDNLIEAPIDRTGVYVLAYQPPTTEWHLYLPLLRK